MEMYKQNNEYHCMSAMRRVFCIFSLLIILVGNAWGATVTETYEVPSTKSFTAGTAFNPTENIIFTYGIATEDGKWSVKTANSVNYIQCSSGPNYSPGATKGGFLVVTPVVDGSLSLDVYVNSDGERYVYVYEENEESAIVSNSNGTNGKSVVKLEFDVTKGKNYYVMGAKNQNNAWFGGYTFTYESGATDYSCLSVGSTSKTVSNKYIYENESCDAKYSDETRLMDCVNNNGYVKFKIKPTIAGNYLLTSEIGTKNANRHVEISCTGDSYSYSKKHDISNNGSWTDGDSYEWIFENLEANKEYVVTITCTDTNKDGASDGNYQVNVLTTTIVKTDRKNAVETTTSLSVSDFNYNDETSGESLNRSGMLGFNITFGGGDAAKYNNTSSGVNIRYGDGTITVALANTDADNGIKAVKFTGSSIQGAITASVGGTWSSASNNTITWTATEATSKSVTFTSKSDVEFKITKLDITTTDVVGGTKATPVLAFQNTTVEKNTNAGTFTNTLTTTPQNFKVVYSFNNGTTSGTTCTDKLTGSTINTTTGEVTVGATAGQAQVIATFGGNTCFNAVSASYTLNVQGSEVVTPAGGTFSMTDGLVAVNDENDLGLDLLSSAETFTVTGPNTSNPTYPSGSSTMDKFANGAVITYFNGYYYCMWQSSNEGEDSQDTWVAYSRSADGITWETPKVLVSDDTSNNVINTSGGWYVDKTNNKLIGYINNWTVSGWSDTDVNYYGNTTTGKKIGDKQSLKTCYVSTTDGVTWTSPAEVKMSDGSTLDGIFEQDPYVTSSGRIINAAHFTSSLVPCPIYTDNVDGVTGWKKATTFDINGSGGMEPSVYQKTDGTTVMEFRTGSYCKYASASTDNGVTWTAVEATNVPDAHTKQSAGNLPDGTSYLVGTPKNVKSADVTDSNTERLLRKPLAILLSKDGTTFDTGYCLRTSDDNGGKNASGTYDGIDAAGGHAYSGLYKRPGYHYTKSMVANGYLWISYATNKETVQVTRIPLSDISLNTVEANEECMVNIDFNQSDYTNADYFTSDYVAKTVDIKKGSTADVTSNDVTVKVGISSEYDKESEYIKSTWYKYGVDGSAATEESKLVCDGIYPRLENDDNGIGYGGTKKQVAIDVTISGLPAGKHTIEAFHNYTFNTTDVLPTVGVKVGGTTELTGVVQSKQAMTIHDAASSFVEFDVTNPQTPVVITYFSEQTGDIYTTTRFFINAIRIDGGAPITRMAYSPTPADQNYRVEDNSGTVEMTWKSANNATSHVVYFSTDKKDVEDGSAEFTTHTSTATSLTKTGLSPLKRYYWRVDEVVGGVTYKGNVWSFQPRRLAFPGAEGAGKYAVGGRGYNGNGIVYHVTSLEDDSLKVGTLRYGLVNPEMIGKPRTIVFDVSGAIKLTKRLNSSDPYVTIAGQTAPGIGVLVRDQPFGANSDEGVTRFMRFRYGHGDDWTDESSANQNVGNAAGLSGDYAIMDHCLLAWGSDETFSSRGAKNITFQHSLIGESLNQNGHKNYYDEDPNVQHGYAATIAGEVGSFHHNLLAHNEGRNWSLGGGLDAAGYYAGMKNIYNNIVYNWRNRTTDGGTHNCHFVGNYYKEGPSSVVKHVLSADHEGAGKGTQEYYVNDNKRVSQDGNTVTTDASEIYRETYKSGVTIDWTTFVSEPDGFKTMSYPFYHIDKDNIESADAAFKNVLSDVGCNFQQLDNNEKRLIEETLKGTYSKTGSRSNLLGLIDKESDSEGWGGLGMIEAERPTGWDSDGDGIPAWFEGAKGWDDAAANNNADSDGDYYTDLEEYLNWMAVPHFYNTNDGTVTALETGTNHTITLADYFAGYTSPTYTVVSNGGATATINNGVLTYNFPANASKLATIQVKATQDGISLTRSFNFFIDASDVEVTPEGTEYMIAASTNTGSNTGFEYNFTDNGAQFTVTNTKDKGYGTGNEDGVKYSANVQYTITIPEGCSVNGIKFSGYNNYDGTDAYIGEVNGTTYESTEYVFPMKDGEGNSTSKEYTIHFADPVTNSLTFTPKDKQCVWAITLYITGTPAVTPDDDTELAPAFPGAEGSGRYAQGGRGTNGTTNVYHVTSLKDDKNVEGTLRWALAQDGPRTIVFDVSGYIDLASDLKIPSNTTIAGQTAPAPGITLRYYTVNTSDAENVIIRYMRFRRSQVKDVNDGADAAWGRHGNNIILDHCSFSWSIDEVASFYDNRDFTMQWCVVAEGLCNSGHTKGGHSYGGIWGGKNATFHHNMITNVHNRTPRLCGARFNWNGYDKTYDNSVQAERVDVRNNLYYNWGNGNGAYGGMGGYHNLVNNYYKAGPGTTNKSRVFQGGTISSDDSENGLPAGLPGRFYIDGNYVTAQNKIYDWKGFKQDSGTGVNTTDTTYTDSQGLYGTAGATVNIKLDEEVDMADVTTHTAANAYNQILLYGGASLYRDAVDERFMTDATNGTTSYKMTETTDGEGNAVTEFTEGIVDKINDPAAAAVAGQPSFPMLAVVERPTNWDTDRDGMPDAWEDANGLDKNNAADGNLYTLDSEKTWYTNLEVYLNSIVEDITKEQTSGAEIEIEDEYYPTWTKPTAESLTEFVLSDETHSYGSANVWTFSNGFGVTGDAGRTYASAGDYIKYSDGYEYTISVPSNVTVYKVKVEGYANAEVGTTSYLEAFGTQTFDATRYVFPSGNASVNRASYEFTLPTAVTGGTLKIQATGAQTCLIVTLYGKEKSYDLDEVANEKTTTLEEVEETGTIKWVMSSGTITEEAVYTDINSAGFSSDEISHGTNVACTGTMTASSYTETKFKTTQSLEETEENAIDFTVTLRDGYTFVPEKVEFVASRGGTDAGTLSVKFYDGKEYTDLDDFRPGRYNRDEAFTHKSYEVSKGELSGTFGMRFFIKNVGGKEYGLCNIIIHGTLKYESSKTTVTLDEMATVHSLDAADNVTVEMKRGLTAGAWNTFCVPFSVSKDKLQEALGGSDVEIVEYTSQEGTTLYFADTDSIEAGKPYLIKPASFSRTYDESKTTPITFEGVNLVAANMKSNSRDVAGEVCPGVADYSFVGTYVRYIMETNGTELGLNSKNKLAKPAASTNIMRGLRGFFRYNAGNGAGAKVVINGELTSIDEIEGFGTMGAEGVYHISGHFVRKGWNNGDGLQRGVYIVNGKKMVKY